VAEAGIQWEKSYERTYDTQAHLFGSKTIVGRNFGSSNAVQWKLIEDKSQLDGIPSYLRTAVLLKRKSDDRFLGTIKIEVEISGLSFDLRHTIQKVVGGIQDDQVVFDPLARPRGPLSNILDLRNLIQCDLNSLATVISTTVEDTQRLVSSQFQTMTDVAAKLDASTAEPQEKPGTPPVPVDEQETFFVELWSGLPSLTPGGDRIENDHSGISRTSGATKLGTLPDIFGDVPAEH
jgi:hypothetical protein